MRTSKVAFTAGAGGAIFGWVLAAMLGATQAEPETNSDAESAEASSEASGDDQPELRLKPAAIIEGPVTEYSYRVAQNNIQTKLNESDLFAWVYPDYAVIGPVGSDRVMVVPRESLVAIQMFDVGESPRQRYRRIADQTGNQAQPRQEDRTQIDEANAPLSEREREDSQPQTKAKASEEASAESPP